jgi:two-component system OmpR family sensor kinase
MWPRGIRARLAVAITLVTVGVLGVSFFVLHQRTGSDLESRIDDQLAGDRQEFESSPAEQSRTSGQLARRARAFVNGQAYHPDSRIFAIQTGPAGPVITNSEELIESELGESEDGDEGEVEDSGAGPSGVLSANAGYETLAAGGDARVRVLTEPVTSGGRQIGTFHVAQSLSQVATAKDSLENTFLVVGAIALALVLVTAVWIATLTARPLDRIARFAAGVDRGELDRRLDDRGGPAEIQSLRTSLNHMLDRLQRAFDREREFVADASHELRTPITVAQGELDLLRRDADPQERERLDVVRRELQRMERLIGEMLSLAREDAGRSLDRRTVAVDDLLDDLRRDLPLFGPREYEVGALGGTLEADSDRIAQVLRNLARNAVTHTSPGGHVEIRAGAEGDQLRIEVIDDGPGIPPEEAAHLFERFYRSAETRSRDRDGSGLGLAIARAIVEAHGGRIWADTGQTPGARLVVELPGYRPSDEGARSRPSTTPARRV